MNELEQKFYDAFLYEEQNDDMCYIGTIEPQVVIGIYKADFVVDGEFVIEIDGHEYHKTKEQREQDYKRERYLMRNGYLVIRFTGTEVFLSPNECAMDARTIINQILEKREIKEVSACFDYYDRRKQREEQLCE